MAKDKRSGVAAGPLFSRGGTLQPFDLEPARRQHVDDAVLIHQVGGADSDEGRAGTLHHRFDLVGPVGVAIDQGGVVDVLVNVAGVDAVQAARLGGVALQPGGDGGIQIGDDAVGAADIIVQIGDLRLFA